MKIFQRRDAETPINSTVLLLSCVLRLVVMLGVTQLGRAAVIDATPSNYRALLKELQPGDTLNLKPGTYPRLYISSLNGTPAAWITITGPAPDAHAVIVGDAGHNAIEIVNSSYVAIENLRIDGRGIPGVFGVSAKGREQNLTHHIRIEGNIFVGQSGGQQTDAISTKIPTWGWIIRGNQIFGAGAGLYLGDSDGTQPFVGGLIENNLVKDTIGYNMEIKDQISIPDMPGMPQGPTSTIIRNNVFIKNDQPSPDGNRPNVLLGAFPSADRGSLNMYEVYGNYFVHNHREALFQASGRISLHDNIFVDGTYAVPAVSLRHQNYPLKVAYVYNNTIYTPGTGINFRSSALVEDIVAGNLVFGLTPISGEISRKANNIVDTLENAAKYVRAPSFDLGSMDFYPLPGKCQGAAIDLSPFHSNTDYTLDFNGVPKTRAKGAVVVRGANAGEGTNPGWQLQAGIKPPYSLSPNVAATLVWIDPPGGQPGTTTPVTLTGANFASGATVATSGDGITVSNVSVVSATQITATFVVAARVPAGFRDVTVTTPAGSTNSLKFGVNARGSRPPR